MPDLHDLHRRAGFEANAVKRLLDRARGAAEAPAGEGATQSAVDITSQSHTTRGESAHFDTIANDAESAGPGTEARIIVLSAGNKAASPVSVATKRGRGAKRTETREELLNRLLDPVLTLEETARMLEVCPTTVRRYTNRGILPHERSKGNQRRFRLSSVLAFMESQSRVGPVVEEG